MFFPTNYKNNQFFGISMKIVISGTPASGKSSVAKLVAKKLGLKHFSMGDFQRELAKEHGVDIVTWGKMEADDEKYDKMVDDRQKKIGEENDDFVIDSWLGAHFIPDAVKFYVDAKIDIRAKRRLAHKRKEEDYSDLDQVKNEMERREKINKERWYRYYQFDYTDKTNYDYVIDTSIISIEQVTDDIIQKLRKHLNTKPKPKNNT